MKTCLVILSILFLTAIFCACNRGPKDEIVKNDINTYLTNRAGACAKGRMTRQVNEIKIVGKKSVGDAKVIQAVANANNSGPCTSSRGTFDYEISISYEKFGDGWRVKEFGFDYKQIYK